MKDPVALAYSGRLDEARAAAIAQVSSGDDFLAGQGLEALAVLGQQHGFRTDDDVDRLLDAREREGGVLSRRAFEAAAALGSRALEEAAARRLESGSASWDVLRYAGEWPSYRIALALAEGWDRLPVRMLDEALLTSCAMPAANRAEAAEWGRRASAAMRSEAEDVRVAAVVAVRTWRPEDAAELCSRALEDESPRVRREAAATLALVDPELLATRAEELVDEYPEAMAAVPPAIRERKVRRH